MVLHELFNRLSRRSGSIRDGPRLGAAGIAQQIGGQRRGYLAYRAVNRLSAGGDDAMRCLAIERIALIDQRFDPCARISRLKQGTRAVTPQPLPQIVHTGLQVNDKPQAMQQSATVGIDYRATAGCEHATGGLCELRDEVRLAAAKTLLTLELENGGYRHAAALLKHRVGIDKWAAERCRKSPTHGGLSRTHHADQNDVAHVRD